MHFRLLRYPGPDGVRPSTLAGRLGLSKQAINPLVNDLEQWGYIARARDPADGRARILRLTPRGRMLLKKIRQLHAEIEQEWQEALGRKRFKTVHRTLQELVGRGSLPAR